MRPTLRDDCWSKAPAASGQGFGYEPVGLEPHPLQPQQKLVDGVLGFDGIARARIAVPPFEIMVVGSVGSVRHKGRSGHQTVTDIGRQMQPEEMHQRQMRAGIDGIV
jgi:hypothetical protein